jgi:hypothetical protein
VPARIRVKPQASAVASPGPWTVEVDLGPQGLAAGGALKLVWADSTQFADSSKMKPVEAEHDIRVTSPAGVPWEIEHCWLPRCQDGQVVVCRAQGPVDPHTTVAIVFGAVGRWQLGRTAHTYPLRVWEDVTGSGLFRIIWEAHALRSVAGPPARVEAILGPPAAGAAGHTLYINLWDEHGNPAPRAATAWVSAGEGAPLRVDLDGQTASTPLPLPASGPSATTYTVQVPALGLSATANPAPQPQDPALHLYFGEIHCHTALSDGMRSIDDLYTFARDVQRLDFASATDHESHIYGYSLAPDMWPLVREAAGRYNEPGRFVTLLGYEWAALQAGSLSGHYNVYYRGDDGPFLTSSDPATASLAGLLQALRAYGRPALVIPHHPLACKNAAGRPDPTLTCHWRAHDRDLIRLVEIYSKWGCSEEVPPEFRPLFFSQPGHAVRDALQRGYRLGFTAGSDGHVAMPGSLHQEGGNLRYAQSGLVAVYAPALTREAIFDALSARRCYATSGPRIVLDLSLNGHPMGSEVEVAAVDAPRLLSLEVNGTTPIDRVEIISAGQVRWRCAGGGRQSLSWQTLDRSPLRGPVYYYARVIQADGERAWSSPIWVDPPAGCATIDGERPTPPPPAPGATDEGLCRPL